MALKFDGTHICKSPPTGIARFDLLASESSHDRFTGDLEIDVNIVKEETQASPGKPPVNGDSTSEQKGPTETVNLNNGTSSGHTTHYVVVLDLNDSTGQVRVSHNMIFSP